MKILVIGGTGLIGTQVSKQLKEKGHDVLIGSPSKGIDIITGKGLSESLTCTDIVIDLSNSKSPESEEALNFFRSAAEQLVPAEIAAGVKHHLILSIVGTDRAQHIGYLQAKKSQEDAIITSGVPYTVIRSTQFHEHTPTIVAVQSEGKNVHVSTLEYQPIAASDVVDYVVKFALQEPKNTVVEIAGPDRGPMTEFVESYLKAKGEDKIVVANQDDKYMFFNISRSGLVPLGQFYSGEIRYADWITTQ